MSIIIDKLKEKSKHPFFSNPIYSKDSGLIRFEDENYNAVLPADSKVLTLKRKEFEEVSAPTIRESVLEFHRLAESMKLRDGKLDLKKLKKFYLVSDRRKYPNYFNLLSTPNGLILKIVEDYGIEVERYNKDLKNWGEYKEKKSKEYLENAKFLLSMRKEINIIREEGFELETSLTSSFYNDLIEVLDSSDINCYD